MSGAPVRLYVRHDPVLCLMTPSSKFLQSMIAQNIPVVCELNKHYEILTRSLKHGWGIEI